MNKKHQRVILRFRGILRFLIKIGLLGVAIKKAFNIPVAEIFENLARKLLITLGIQNLSIEVKLSDNRGVLLVPALEYWRITTLSSSTFEPWLRDFLKAEPGWTVVDVGAHIGYHTIALSKEVGPSGKVFSIEPHPDNFKLLEKNVKVNNCSNVLPVNVALSDKEGFQKLYLGRYSGECSIHYLKVKKNFLTVPVTTFDSLLSKLKTHEINLIKIDVEGAELEVLKGAERTLVENKHLSIVVEVHEPLMRVADCKIHQYLKSKGFVIKPIHSTTSRRYIYACKMLVT